MGPKRHYASFGLRCMQGGSFVTTGGGTGVVVGVDALQWVVTEWKWPEDKGRGEGGLSSSCCRCQRWCRFVCMSYLPSESSKYFETQAEKPAQPVTWVWVLNGYLKRDPYLYLSNPYPHTWWVSKPMTCTKHNLILNKLRTQNCKG